MVIAQLFIKAWFQVNGAALQLLRKIIFIQIALDIGILLRRQIKGSSIINHQINGEVLQQLQIFFRHLPSKAQRNAPGEAIIARRQKRHGDALAMMLRCQLHNALIGAAQQHNLHILTTAPTGSDSMNDVLRF